MIFSAATDPFGTNRRMWWLSLGVSLTAHALLIIAISLRSLARPGGLSFSVKIPPAPELEMTYTKVIPGEQGGGDIVDNIVDSIPERLEQAKNLSEEERARQISERLGELEGVRESSLDEIADLFQEQERAYEPVNPPPAGQFDLESQIPYSMEMLEDGSYTMLLLDKDGRTMEVEFGQDEVTDDLKAAYDVFKMMDKMPALRRVYMRMAAQYLPQLQEEGGKKNDE